MRTETRGIVLKSTKPVGGRSMLVILTEDYGKISCGTAVNMKGRNRNSLAVSPFTHANYQLFKNSNSYNLSSAEVIRNYYQIGEDIDKFMAASRVLELTDRFLAEGEDAPAMYNLLKEYLDELSERKKDFDTLNLAFEYKALRILGVLPTLTSCVSCGTDSNLVKLDVEQGGRMCEKCLENDKKTGNASLIFDMSNDIVKVVLFLVKKPLGALRNLTLQDDVKAQLGDIFNAWISYHLDIDNLRSESMKL